MVILQIKRKFGFGDEHLRSVLEGLMNRGQEKKEEEEGEGKFQDLAQDVIVIQSEDEVEQAKKKVQELQGKTNEKVFFQLDSKITVKSQLKLQFKSEIEYILHYQQQIAALTFVQKGYGITHLQQQLNHRGGLFEITQSRYKKMTTNFVIEAYKKILRSLDQNGYVTYQKTKVETIALHSILLNCKKHFDERQVNLFMQFIVLMNDEDCQEITISRKIIISFYETSVGKIREKLFQSRRGVGDGHVNIHKENRDILLMPKAEPKPKTEREIIQDHIIGLYLKNQKISATKEEFLQLFGAHQKYTMYTQFQTVIHRWVRKTVRDIQKYCEDNPYTIFPFRKALRDAQIKQLNMSPNALFLRLKLLRLAMQFKREKHRVISKGYQFCVDSWQVEGSRLLQLDRTMIIEVIQEIYGYFQKQNDNWEEDDKLPMFVGASGFTVFGRRETILQTKNKIKKNKSVYPYLNYKLNLKQKQFSSLIF